MVAYSSHLAASSGSCSQFISRPRRLKRGCFPLSGLAGTKTVLYCLARPSARAEPKRLVVEAARTSGPSGTEGILFQAAFEADHHLNMSGTHEEWRQHIGRFCSARAD